MSVHSHKLITNFETSNLKKRRISNITIIDLNLGKLKRLIHNFGVKRGLNLS